MNAPTPTQLLIDMAHALKEGRSETMNPSDSALFDMMLMVELYKRGAVKDLYLEMRILADKHLRTAPYVAGLMKAIAQHIAPDRANILAFKPGGNPCP